MEAHKRERQIATAWKRYLGDARLTVPEAHVLLALYDGDHRYYGELRHAMGLSVSHFSRVINKLQRKGLIRLDRAEWSARICVIWITADGEAARVWLQESATAVQRMFGVLPESPRS